MDVGPRRLHPGRGPRVRPRLAGRPSRGHRRGARGRLPGGLDDAGRDRGPDERIRLGILVSSNTFRHPALLLKEAVTVDHISAGRVILGVGTGWHEDEHRRYGIDLPAPAERVDRFEEAVECISLLMGQERTTYHGRHYQLEDARLEPRPIQQPRIPILIAAHRPRMLRIAARYADQWDTFAAIAGTATDGVEAGRSPNGSRRSTRPVARSGATPLRSGGRPGPRARRCARPRPTSTSSGATYRLGFTDFSTVRPAAGDEGVLRAIARDVVPELRAGRLLD